MPLWTELAELYQIATNCSNSQPMRARDYLKPAVCDQLIDGMWRLYTAIQSSLVPISQSA